MTHEIGIGNAPIADDDISWPISDSWAFQGGENEPDAPNIIPYLWARLCIGCGGIFDIRKSRFWEFRKMQFCSKKCYDSFTIIPAEIILKTEQDKRLELYKERMYRERLKLTAKMRFDILKRDKFRCFYCGKKPNENIQLVVDHIIPIVKEGLTECPNLVSCCNECNSGKSDTWFSQDVLREIQRRIKENES